MKDIPFSSLEATEVRQIYGRPPFDQPPPREVLFVRGNYVAGSIACRLRKERLANRNYFRDLSIMFALPMELVFEIFEHLHPIDLYNLIRSSKSLRNLLLVRQSAPLWDTVFERHPDIPRCPPDLSFPKWVSLLFGPPSCDKCGHPEAMVDFTFLDRICNACFDNHRLDEDSPVFDIYEDRSELLTLVRGSYHDDGMIPSQMNYYLYYSKHEVEETGNQIRYLKSAIEADVPNAAWQLEKFKAVTLASVCKSMDVAETCDRWCLNAYEKIDCQYDELVQRWQTRMAALGYHPKDIEAAKWDIGSCLRGLRVIKSIKKGFKRSLPDIQAILSRFKEERLAIERGTRRGVVRTFYQAYQKSTDPAEWKYLPGVETIYTIRMISDYIHSELEDDIFAEEAAKVPIQLYVNKCKAYSRYHLSRIMHEMYPPDTIVGLNKDPLSLAAAVFECPRKHVFIGWEDAWRHFDCIVPAYPDFMVEEIHAINTPAYSLAGYGIIKYLLGLLGCDPCTTSTSELETLKARFLCMIPNCPECEYNYNGRDVLTLKECFMHSQVGCHEPRSFGLLSEEATKSVLLFESQAPLAIAFNYSWSCKLCPEHFERRLPRADVIKHVRERHSIACPDENTDIFYCHWRDGYRRKPFYLNMKANYRCNRCLDTRKLRLWTLQTLTPHLKDKHAVNQPIPGVDWIELVLLKDANLSLPLKA